MEDVERYDLIPTDDELRARFRNTEDHFVERKGSSDKRGWLKTAVAFANSAPVGFPCVLYVGVRDDGSGQSDKHTADLDALQQTVAATINKAYPQIAFYPRVYSVNGSQALAIVIPGSKQRPHFSGPAFVREGQSTREASESQYAELIAERSSKVYEILKSKGTRIAVQIKSRGGPTIIRTAQLLDCNQFFITLKDANDKEPRSVPLEEVQLSYSHRFKCLLLSWAHS